MNENTDAASMDSQGAMPHHPFFDRFGPHSALDCLDAMNRVACVIDVFSHLTLSNDADEGLSSRAAYGYTWLSESARETLTYCSRRLSTLSHERRTEEKEQARYLSALLASLSALQDRERDYVLNAMAAQLDITRSDVDTFIDRTAQGETET